MANASASGCAPNAICASAYADRQRGIRIHQAEYFAHVLAHGPLNGPGNCGMWRNKSKCGSSFAACRPKAAAPCTPAASPQNASAISVRAVLTRIRMPIQVTGLSARLANRGPNRCPPVSGHSASRAAGILPNGSKAETATENQAEKERLNAFGGRPVLSAPHASNATNRKEVVELDGFERPQIASYTRRNAFRITDTAAIMPVPNGARNNKPMRDSLRLPRRAPRILAGAPEIQTPSRPRSA